MKHLPARKLQKHQQLIVMKFTSYPWFVRGLKKKAGSRRLLGKVA